MKDLYWAAGFLEGEGSFSSSGNRLCVNAAQVQKVPLLRIKSLFGGSIGVRKQHPSHKGGTIFHWDVFSSRAVGVMMTLFNLMSPKRQEQILKRLKIWKSSKPHPKHRTHCPRGHKFTKFNTYYTKKGRMCRKCTLSKQAEYKRKKRVSFRKSCSKDQLSFQF